MEQAFLLRSNSRQNYSLRVQNCHEILLEKFVGNSNVLESLFEPGKQFIEVVELQLSNPLSILRGNKKRPVSTRSPVGEVTDRKRSMLPVIIFIIYNSKNFRLRFLEFCSNLPFQPHFNKFYKGGTGCA